MANAAVFSYNAFIVGYSDTDRYRSKHLQSVLIEAAKLAPRLSPEGL
jgi:hypothetical protein